MKRSSLEGDQSLLSLGSLPNDIMIEHISSFLTRAEWRYCLIVCRAFRSLRKNAVYFNLTPAKSNLYLQSVIHHVNSWPFHEQLNYILHNPRKQLSLALEWREEMSLTLPLFLPTSLNGIRISGIFHDEIDCLGFHYLEHVVLYSFSVIHNQLALQQLRSLTLIRCPNITDVSLFRDIPVLKFQFCPGLVIINSLSNVKNLCLSHCNNISLVSALTKAEEITIIGCRKFRSIEGIPNAKIVSILDCEEYLDPTNIGNGTAVKRLTLSGCTHIADVSALKFVYYLDLSNCSKLEDICCLRNIHTLIIVNCKQVSDINCLSNVICLDASKCSNIKTVTEGMAKIISLKLNNCSSLQEIGLLATLKHLSVLGCRNLKSVARMEQVTTVSFCLCMKDQLNITWSHLNYCRDSCFCKAFTPKMILLNV